MNLSSDWSLVCFGPKLIQGDPNKSSRCSENHLSQWEGDYLHRHTLLTIYKLSLSTLLTKHKLQLAGYNEFPIIED